MAGADIGAANSCLRLQGAGYIVIGAIRFQVLINVFYAFLNGTRRPEQRADHDQQEDQRQVSGEQPKTSQNLTQIAWSRRPHRDCESGSTDQAHSF